MALGRIFTRDDDDDRLHPKVRSHRSEEQIGFMQRAMRSRPRLSKPLNQLEPRGIHVDRAPENSQHVIVKSDHVTPSSSGSMRQQTSRHLSYLQEMGTAEDGGRAQLFSGEGMMVESKAFALAANDTTHQWRLVVSVKDGDQLDMEDFTQRFMAQVEKDIGTDLSWVAATHHDTEHVHTHIAIQGRDRQGRDLYLKRTYLMHGLRYRAQAIATAALGPVKTHERSQATSLTQRIEVAKTKLKAMMKTHDRAEGVAR